MGVEVSNQLGFPRLHTETPLEASFPLTFLTTFPGAPFFPCQCLPNSLAQFLLVVVCCCYCFLSQLCGFSPEHHHSRHRFLLRLLWRCEKKEKSCLLQQVQRFHNKKQTTLFLCKLRWLPLLQNLVRQPQSCLLPRIIESKRSTCHLFCALFQPFNNKNIHKIVCIYPSPIPVFFLFPVLVSFCYYTSKVSTTPLSLSRSRSLILSVHVTRS